MSVQNVPIDALSYSVYDITDSDREAYMTAEVHPLGGKKAGAGAHSRRGKFVELAEKRTVNAIKAIRVIGKLGNKSHYEYDESDVKKIVSVLSREIDALKSRMLTRGSRDSVEFKL